MSNPSRHEGDHYYAGTVTIKTLSAPTALWKNEHIDPAAAIAASKLEHQHEISRYLTSHTTNAATMRVVVHTVYGATGTIVAFYAGATVAAGASSQAVVTLRVNGAVVLTASITLDDAVAAYELVAAGGFTSTDLVAQDVIEAEIVSVSGANLPKGVFVVLVIRSDAN